MTLDRILHGYCCVASLVIGSCLLWLGGTALPIGAMCWFMAGGFFERGLRGTQ